MSHHKRKNQSVRADQRAAAASRVALEERHEERFVDRSDRASWVTFGPNLTEPRHRWLPYRQGLARALVDAFLAEAELAKLPVLDPFAGTGTVPLAVAQRGRTGIGVEVVAALALAARLKATTPTGAIPTLPPIPPGVTLADWARPFTHPLHKACALATAARTVGGDGRTRRGPTSLDAIALDAWRDIVQDARTPVPGTVRILHADARALPLADGSIGGVLTSPPYLSRYDYVRIAEPLTLVHDAWHTSADRRAARERQVSSHPRAHARRWSTAPHAAVSEVQALLAGAGEPKLAGVVRSYFDDLATSLAELARVLAPGAPAWIVVAGASLKRIYVPADLILAELAQDTGLELESIDFTRTLGDIERLLGAREAVTPRESIIRLRKSAW